MKHHVPVGVEYGWEFNDSTDKPTLTPSVGRQATTGNPKCHSNITEGFIHFHGDSDHALAGHVVEMVDIV